MDAFNSDVIELYSRKPVILYHMAYNLIFDHPYEFCIQQRFITNLEHTKFKHRTKCKNKSTLVLNKSFSSSSVQILLCDRVIKA
jgi:hypothetical protein